MPLEVIPPVKSDFRQVRFEVAEIPDFLALRLAPRLGLGPWLSVG